jgi:hypothetical protein
MIPGATTTSLEFTPKQRLEMQLETIFMPLARKQRDVLYENRTSFVHYTSAEAALNIIKTKRVWMRNATCMTDYHEVQHGFDILARNLLAESPKKKEFLGAIEAVAPGAADEALTLFNGWWNDIRFSSYITSISEHDDKEDVRGRLSMWRAFGGNAARVALVLRLPFFSSGTESLNLIFSPVAYLSEDEVRSQIDQVIKNIHAATRFLRTVERQTVVNYVYQMLVAGVTCLKHEAFHEEREWRAIYGPQRLPSPLVESAIEVIGGVPQIVCKLPLDAAVSPNLGDLDFASVFDRLIIGPTPYPWPMYQAFVATLSKAGVADAAKRVFSSNIPIRS